MSFFTGLQRAQRRRWQFTDSDARDWATRVYVKQGVWPERHVCRAAENFIKTLKSTPSPVEGATNWDNVTALCFLAGPQTLTGTLVSVKGPDPQSFGFVSGDYHVTQGLKGDGTTAKYLNTQTPDDDPTSLHYATWATTPSAPGIVEGLMGQAGATPSVLYRDDTTTGSGVPPNPHMSARLNNSTLVRINLGGTTEEYNTGFFGMTRNPGSSTLAYYETPKARGSVSINASASTPASHYRVFHNGGSSFPSPSRLSFYSLGEAVDLAVLHIAMAHYMDEIAGVDEAFDPDAWDYIKRVETADKQKLSPEIREAMNDFVVQCKVDESPVAGVSNWDAMISCAFLSGARTLAGMLVPLKGPAITNTNFVSGDYNTVTGLKGNGTNKFLTVAGVTRVNYPILKTIDKHIAVFSTTPHSSNADNSIYASWSAFGNLNTSIRKIEDNQVSMNVNGNGGTFLTFTPDDPDFTGFMGTARSPGFPTNEIQGLVSDEDLRKLIGAIGGAGSLDSNSLGIFCYNGGAGGRSAARLSYFSLGSSTDLVALRAAVKAYMKKLELLQQAYTDTEAYETLIISQGGTISEEEFNNIHEFAKGLYLLAGEPVDFVDFKHNLGTGSSARSFHGQICGFTNGPEWAGDGVALNGAGTQKYVNVNSIMGGASKSGECTWVFVGKRGIDGGGPVFQSHGASWPLDPQMVGGASTITTAYRDSNDSNTWGSGYIVEDLDTQNFTMYFLSKMPNGDGVGGFNGEIWVGNFNGETSNYSGQGFVLYNNNSTAGTIVSFAVRLPIGSMTNELHQNLYNLYKNTIGKGLELP